MFYQQRRHCYHSHGFFFILSLIVAFFLGRKSQEYGLTIVSRGCDCYEDDDMDMKDEQSQDSYS